MACPTCGGTMANVSISTWHCARCGTLRMTHRGIDVPKDYVPTIVERADAVVRSADHWPGWISCRDLAEAIGKKFPAEDPAPDPATLEGQIRLANLQDEGDRNMLYDALVEAGRDEEAQAVREGHPDLTKFKDPRLGWVIDLLPF